MPSNSDYKKCRICSMLDQDPLCDERSLSVHDFLPYVRYRQRTCGCTGDLRSGQRCMFCAGSNCPHGSAHPITKTVGEEDDMPALEPQSLVVGSAAAEDDMPALEPKSPVVGSAAAEDGAFLTEEMLDDFSNWLSGDKPIEEFMNILNAAHAPTGAAGGVSSSATSCAAGGVSSSATSRAAGGVSSSATSRAAGGGASSSVISRAAGGVSSSATSRAVGGTTAEESYKKMVDFIRTGVIIGQLCDCGSRCGKCG